MFQQCRYISARALLDLPKLSRCQSLPEATWTPAESLWHLVFISHRWGSQDDPDPSGTQLVALKRLVRRMVDIVVAIADDQAGVVEHDCLTLISSFLRQGSLQAAHLVFRTLCDGQSFAVDEAERVEGDGILDLIGFWYDYSCLPQDPKTEAEAQEFSQALQGIGEMILSPRVSTLVLRQDGDGYLERGWCFAESMIAGAKEDVFKPMILRTDRWDEPLEIKLSGAFSTLRTEAERQQQGANANLITMEAAFASVINGTALLLLSKTDDSMSEFVVAATARTNSGLGLLAGIQSTIATLPEGKCLDLSGALASGLRRQGLGCRDEQDYIVVALLLLKSLTAVNAIGDVGIWWEALERFTSGRSLILVRRDDSLTWQD
jgi:hypothetical protein